MTNYSISPSITFSIQGSHSPKKSAPLLNMIEHPVSMEFRGANVPSMKVLDGAKIKEPLKIESANHKDAVSMAQSSRTCEQKADSVGLRVGGCLVGAARAVGLFFWSPITALKYLIVALCQACRCEGKKALRALALAATAPVWAPLDGFYKTYRRFALYGDEKLASIDSKVYKKCERTWLEKQKEAAKTQVIDPKTPWISGGGGGIGSGISCSCYC